MYSHSQDPNQRGKEDMEQNIFHIHVYTEWSCPLNWIYHTAGCATSTSLHNIPNDFFPHKDLLLYKVEKDGGKKLLLQAPTIVSQIPLYEHLCSQSSFNSRTPEHLGPVRDVETAAASRQHLRTEFLSPSFLGPAHLIQFC